MDGRPSFHINIVNQVSPNCDCHPESDAAIVPDVGMFASFDPVAVDVASADAVNRQPVNPMSILAQRAGVAGPLRAAPIPPPTGAPARPTRKKSAWAPGTTSW